MTGTQDRCLEVAAMLLREVAAGWPHPYVKERVEGAAKLIEAVREEAGAVSVGETTPE